MNPFSISITPTAEIIEHNDVPLRVWKGVTPDGVTCTLFVALVRVDPGQDYAAFDTALREVAVEEKFHLAGNPKTLSGTDRRETTS